jgi:hypothetical protein
MEDSAVKNIPLAKLEPCLFARASLVTCLVLGAALGCAGVKTMTNTGGGGSSGNGGGGGSTVIMPMSCNGPCTDFPPDPIGTPNGNFGGSGSGPCVIEPEDGSLFPNNWLRPRIKVADGAGNYKITFHADKEANDLTVYVNGDDNYTLDKNIWSGLARHIVLEDITVTVQKSGGGSSSVKFQVAPVGASGSMVFWAANPALVGANPSDCYANLNLCSSASELQGFAVGDESTVTVLAINQVQELSRADNGNSEPVVCIGCHAGTPDDSFVSIDDHYVWRAALASVGMGTSGAKYTSMTAMGLAAMQQPGWGPFTWTKSNGNMDLWQTGKKIGVASLGLPIVNTPNWSNDPDQNDSPHLAWVNIEAQTVRMPQNGDSTNWAYPSYTPGADINSGNGIGIMQQDCPAGGAATPNFSPDGTAVVFACTNASISGRLNQETPNPAATTQKSNPARKPGMTDLYQVAFNNGLGGHAMPVTGAATTQFEEYYPAFSPDQKFIAFTRVPAGEVMFANPHAELAIVDSGGNAQRLAANDPPKCTGKSSPGVNNHWPKWSPDVPQAGGGTYYWLVFSSTRAGLPPVSDIKNVSHEISQLYMAPVRVTETSVDTFPAIYMWNQPTNRVNTTPAWATFAIPPVK